MQSNSTEPPFKVVFFPLEFPFAISPMLSITANAIVALSFVFTKKSTNPLFGMVLAVNLMDILFCSPRVLSMVIPPSSTMYCHVFQMVVQFGMQSSMLCSAFFGHAFWIFSQDYKFDRVRQMRKYYFIICTAVPLSIAILAFAFPYLEYDSGGCTLFITRREIFENIRFILFFLTPIVASVTLSIIFYFMAAKNLRRFMKDYDANNLLTLIIYPAIVIVCWMPICITNFFVIAGKTPNKYHVLSIQFIAHLQGLFEAIVYSQSKYWLRTLWNYVCCCCRVNTQEKGESQRRKSTIDMEILDNKGGRSYTEYEMERTKSEFHID